MIQTAQKIKRPRLADVASRAGVSVATVSHVLNGRSDVFVGKAARQRVIDSARTLGYRPNIFARGLRTQTTRSFGLIFPGMKNDYLSGLAEAVYREARRRNYHVLLEPDEAADAQGQINAIGNLMARMVEGVVIFWPYGVWNLNPALGMPPIIAVDTDLRMHGDNSMGGVVADEVRVDRAAGIEHAVADLLGRGRRRICLLISEFDDRVTQQRIQGWQRAHRATGAVIDENLIVRVKAEAVYQADIGSGEEIFRRLRTRISHFDAVVASGDVIAMEVCNAMASHGLAVGRDVAVVGFGNIPFCHLMPTHLSSIGFPIADMARTIVEMLIQRIEASPPALHSPPRQVTFPMEYYSRASSSGGGGAALATP